jgi:hypothetical protein
VTPARGASPAIQLASGGRTQLQRQRQQPRMVVALHHPQRVGRHVLARHEPRRVVAAAALRALDLHAADAQPLPLAQRVERQALVLADDAAALVLDRARLLGM